MVKISVIVPVYNTGKYIRNCINSLLQQTLSDIEIVLVDDGSTDESGIICDSFANKNEQISVIHIKHSGLSIARNTGIRFSTAQYLMFVDSDDYVHPNFCKIPYEYAINNNADLVLFSYYYWMKYTCQAPEIDDALKGLITKEEAMCALEMKGFGHMAWNKLYHKSLFNKITYPKNMLYEDLGTTYRLVHEAKHIFCTNERLYYYNTFRKKRITNTPSVNAYKDKFALWIQKNDRLKAWGYDCRDNDLLLAITYLVVLGRNESYSAFCDAIIRETDSLRRGLSIKQYTLTQIYLKTPKAFDTICRIFLNFQRNSD